ncbi:MAG: HAD family hydrolase [Chloroflexota bacterium]
MRLLIWDFDGTLGYREGGMWSSALIELLHKEVPQIEASAEQFRPYLQSGFPWHSPDRPHPEIRTPEQWWDRLTPAFEAVFRSVGVDPSGARRLAHEVRSVYADPERWRLFDDTLPTLDRLTSRGWTHALLSNHVPELRQIIEHLGLGPHLAQVFNSAETGYEKPHPRAFQLVLEAFPDAEAVWMIGDSVRSDVTGAEALGIPALLVRGRDKRARHVCDRVSDVEAVVGGEVETREGGLTRT